MSGFEVAGIVLGSLPLLITALEHYGDGVHTIKAWIKYESELQRVIRNLKTERVRFLNVCEKLLDGLVPASKIDAMVEDPFGALWQEKHTQGKLRTRLWRSWDAFEQTVIAMKVAIEKTLDKLEVGRKKNEGLVTKEFKRAKFTFRLSTYTELLSTIRDGVSSLESLTIMSIDLEPKRRARSDVRFLSILRELSSSMYRAITSSLACACKHKILMRLSTGPVDITPDHDEEEIIRDLKFRLALSSDSIRPAVPRDAEEDAIKDLNTLSWEHWEEIIIQTNTAQVQPQPWHQAGIADKIASLSIADPNCPMPLPTTKQRKAVNFASIRSSTTTTVTTTAPTATSTLTSNTASNPPQGLSLMSHLVPKMTVEVTSIALSSMSSLDLCGKLRKDLSSGPQGDNHEVDFYGVVFDPDHDSVSKTRRSYSVYPAPSLMPDLAKNPLRVVSLRDILEGKDGLPPLGYRHRLQLAVFIARSVLQLYKTPWLPMTPSSRNVFFIIRRERSAQDSTILSYYEHAFVMARSSGGMNKGQESAIIPLIRNPSLLALGVLLIELEKNRTIDSMRLPEEYFTGGQKETQNLLSDYMTAKRLLNEVYQSSSNYGSAVRRCLDCEFRMGSMATSGFGDNGKLDLENEDFRQEVYGGVVALLEEDLRRI